MGPSLVTPALSDVDEIRLSLIHFVSIIQLHFHQGSVFNLVKEGA